LGGKQRALVATMVISGVIYSVYRGSYLDTSDLVHGFLDPTRAILFEHRSLLDFIGNSYPPFFYCVMAPLALLSNGAASAVWTILMFGQVVAIAAMMGAMLEATRGPRNRATVLGPVVLSGLLLADNLHRGQSNVFALFFAVTGLYWVVRGKDFWGGALLSIAIAFKVTPGLFVLYLALKRRWRALIGVALGLLVWFAVPLAVFGPSRGFELNRQWASLVLAPFAIGDQVRTRTADWYHTNQSMEAFLQRQWTPYAEQRYDGLHSVLDPGFLDEGQAHQVATALRLLVLAVLVAALLKNRPVSNPMLTFEVGCVLLAMLFISPSSWYDHYVLAIVAYAASAHELMRRTRRDTGWKLLFGGLAAAWLGTSVSLTPRIQSYSLVFLGHFALFAAMGVYLGWFSRAGPSLSRR
jgi:hypothetical protein